MEENCTCSFTICEIDSVPLLKMVIQIKERLKFKGRIGQQIRYQIYLKYQIFHLNHIMLFSEETNQIFQFVFFKVFFLFLHVYSELLLSRRLEQSKNGPGHRKCCRISHSVNIQNALIGCQSMFDILSMFNVLFGSYLLNENDSCLNIYSKSVWVGKIDEGADQYNQTLYFTIDFIT